MRTVQTCERAYASAQEGFVDAMNQWVTAEQAGVRTLAGKTFDENQNVLQFPHEHALQSTSSALSLIKAKVRQSALTASLIVYSRSRAHRRVSVDVCV